MIAESSDVRRRVLRAVNQDGLLDAAVGFALLVVAIYVHRGAFRRTDVGALGAILPISVLALMRGLRARLTYPRIGYANPQTRGAALAAMILLLALTLAGVGVTLAIELTAFRVTPAHVRFLPLVLGAVVAGWALVMAVRTGFGRFYSYAGLLAVALAVCYGLGLRTALSMIIPMGLAGALMVILGIATLIRFIRTTPRQPGATTDGA